MGLNASKAPATSGPRAEPLDSANYPARLFQVVDLGLQPQRPYKGQEKPPAYMILLGYELSDEFLLDDDGQPDEGRPRVISERFALHRLEAERAKSTQRYGVLDPDNKHDGDFAQLLCTPVNVTIVKDEKKGKVYNNVGGIGPMRPKDAEKCPALVNPPVVFDLDNPNLDEFKKLPDWIKKIITENLEFEGSRLQALLENDDDYKPADTSPTTEEAEEDGEVDKENPY